MISFFLAGFGRWLLLLVFGVILTILMIISSENSKVGKYFKAKELAQKHKVVLMDLLCKFLELAEELKLVYFIYAGSLIGSWRHHGFVPYDDDIDIIISNAQKPALLKALKKLNPDYVGMDGRPIIKFWSKNSTDPIKGATSMAFY
jgi:hypothetical protein